MLLTRVFFTRMISYSLWVTDIKLSRYLLAKVLNSEPVKKKFKSQLQMREKPKFDTAHDELERLRREAQAAIVKTPEKKKKR